MTITETILFNPLNEWFTVKIKVTGRNIGEYHIESVLCDGEDFTQFVIQNNYTQAVLDNYRIDKAICLAQDELRLEEILRFRAERQKALNSIAA